MKNLPWQTFCSLCMLIFFSACSDLDFISEEDYLKNEYAVNWIKRFGLIDQDHDWSMARPVQAHVEPGSFRLGGKVELYTDQPSNGGALMAVVTEPQDLTIDVSKNAKSVYVRAYTADGSRFGHERFAITDGKVNVVHAPSRADQAEPELYPVPETQSRAGETSPQTFRFLLACEDLGSLYDTDFNDVVLGINYVEGDNKFTVTALAAGGLYGTNIIYKHADGTEEPIFETHAALGAGGYENGSYPMINTRTYYGPGDTYTVNLHSGETFSMTADRERFSIVAMRSADEDINTGIHIYAKTDESPAPQILCLAGTWLWPAEQVPITDAYPDFRTWTSDKDASTWADSPVAAKVVPRTYTPEPDIPDIPDVPFTFVAGEHNNNTITIGTKNRSYDFYIPEGLTPGAPLVLSLHGSGDQVRVMTTDVANANNFIVVYPKGIPDMPFPIGFGGSTSGWGADPLGSNYSGYYQDDLDLFKALIQKMYNDYQIDLTRVYCCGFSNGGMMTYANANSACDIFAAFAAVGGIPCNEFHLRTVGDRPVPFLHIHGKDDGRVEYAWLPVIRDCMVARNGCEPNGTSTGEGYTKTVYAAGEGGFPYITYEVDGMDHVCYTDKTEDSNSALTIWKFFENYSLNSTCDATLKWRFNPDELPFPGWDFSIAEHSRGWSVGNGRCLYYGKTHRTETTVPPGGHAPLAANVYRSLQFKPGCYYMRFNTSTARAVDMRIKLQKKNDPSCEKAFNVKIDQGSDEAVIPFRIYSYGEYYIAIDKVNQDHSISVCEIHSSPSLSDFANCTKITDDLYPGEASEWEALSFEASFAQNAPIKPWEQYLTPVVSGGVYTYTNQEGSLNGFAFKTAPFDVTGCDYILLDLAEEPGPGWHFDYLHWPATISGKTQYTLTIPEIPAGEENYTWVASWDETDKQVVVEKYTENNEEKIRCTGIQLQSFDIPQGQTTTIKVKGVYKHHKQ